MIKSYIGDIGYSLFWTYELLRVIYSHIAILTECYSNVLIKRGCTVPIMKRQFVQVRTLKLKLINCASSTSHLTNQRT